MPAVDPYDEAEIQPDHSIIRRIDPVEHVVWDDNRGCRRVSSKAFSASSGEKGGMSVDIEKTIIEGGYDPKKYVTTPVFTGSVVFPARVARELGLWIGYDPLPDNPYHGEVWGKPRPAGTPGTGQHPSRFTKVQKKGLQRASEWYVPIEGVKIS